MKKVCILYGVVEWGYRGKCVPEMPASVLALLAPILGIAGSMLRRRL